MKYFYAFIFMIGSFALSSDAYSESSEAELSLPNLVFDSIQMNSERCGDILLEGWSLWEGEVCLGFSYTYSSEYCRTIIVEGITPPSGMLNSNKNVNVNFFGQGQQQYQQYRQPQQCQTYQQY